MKKPHITLLGFPIRFEPIFFGIVAFLAFTGQSDPIRTALWIAIVTASILIHEMGHATAYRHYGASPTISLHGLGGVTYGHNSGHLTTKQRIVVASAGSLTTMVLLGGPAWLALQALDLTGDANWIMRAIFFVNVVWAAINLAPVFPLDGGHIMDDGLLLATGQQQRKIVHVVSIIACIAIGGYVYLQWNSLFAAMLFGYFGFINFNALNAMSGKAGAPRQRAPSLEQVLQQPNIPESNPATAAPTNPPLHPPTAPPTSPPTTPPTRPPPSI